MRRLFPFKSAASVFTKLNFILLFVILVIVPCSAEELVSGYGDTQDAASLNRSLPEDAAVFSDYDISFADLMAEGSISDGIDEESDALLGEAVPVDTELLQKDAAKEDTISETDDGLLLSDESDPPEAGAVSGYCGGSLIYTFAGGLLQIGGTGDMYDYNDPKDVPWWSYRNSIKTVQFISSPAHIGENAFYQCNELTTVKLSGGIKTIRDYAFAYCFKLKYINIPSSVTEIGSYAFFCCEAFESLTLPAGLTELGNGVFVSCINLQSVTIPDSVKTMGNQVFGNCKNLKSVHLPSGLSTLPAFTFTNCTSLPAYDIPYGCTAVGRGAFQGCTKLKSVSIPESVKVISVEAFKECSALSAVELPYSITTLGADAFRDCTGLKTVRIRNNITPIGRGAFCGCSALKDVYFYGTSYDWSILIIGQDNEPLKNAAVHYFNPMYRLYNPNNGEHFYTGNREEWAHLKGIGWVAEGVGWYAPNSGSVVVFRLYNPKKGFEEHHYTADLNEISVLKNQYGWNLEGPAWASNDAKEVPVYRLFNPKSPNSASSHHYTTDENEKNVLTQKQGWNYEGIAWYGCK